ncbi:krueppel c2h2-type zinc finger protein, putative [Paecilomyces variotii No. 5]|uniref:Krueppel c2h2-type zinc finger protein, putative n=1 Tax=Byssochlamys spectabilis (strain No. 5 / NBRC 109023) TaxID=1356009 RepID=V5G8V2_BYSSN|nr:krueppel c2h2-type zinc finger protein, putative [Paecilomyces variotii No. 5]
MSSPGTISTPTEAIPKADDGSRWDRFKHAFTSWRAFHNAIRLKSASSILVNEDLLPSPPKRQTWTTWNFFAYWWSESWAVSTWSLGSSLIALGASVRDALLVVFFADLLSAVVIIFNGRAAALYHVGYPVLARVPFGVYGSYFFVVLRAILGIIWGGVQLYFEGQFVSICLRCIFPGWTKIQNGIPASQYITTQVMVGFFLAFLFTLPLMFIHTTKIRHLFSIKSFILPLAGMGIVCWATTANGGVAADKLVNESLRPPTSVFAWGIISQFNAVMGANSALLVTVPDLARYSKTRNAQLYGQLLGLPLAGTLCAGFGIITTSAVKNMYGEAFWNPYDLLNGILDHSYSSKARAGVFFASAAFAFATLGTSIACNIVPFAADVTCLAPRYINIVRGQFICLIIAFAIVPWRIVSTANGFLSFLNGYSIFQGPVVGVMIVDYFVIRRGNLHLGDMFSQSPLGRYFYMKGVNIVGVAAFIIGFLLPLPGFIASFGTGAKVNAAATDMFDLGWILSFLMGGLSYWVINSGLSVLSRKGKPNKLPFETQVPKHIEWGGSSGTLIIDGVEMGVSTTMVETNTNDESRAEKNRPKQIFQCSSCPKKFVRRDLLRRHEKRHEMGMWYRNSGGYVSPGPSCDDSQGLEQSQAKEPVAMGFSDISNTVDEIDKARHDIGEGQPAGFGYDIGDAIPGEQVTSLFFDPSLNISDPWLDFEWLFDNISTDINSVTNGDFPAVSPQSNISAEGISASPFKIQSPYVDSPASPHTSTSSPWVTVRANLLMALNTLAPEILMSSFFYPSNLYLFYDLYFRNYHAHFPILHRPTLDPANAPPLLIAAIVTLGSTLSDDEEHFRTAISIHDSLRYTIFNTPDFEPPASLWCVQTLLIIQAHEKMFSTRKHHQLSHIFHGAIITLMKRGVTYSPAQTGYSSRDVTTPDQSWHQWIETQSSNRTAFFGFVMDAQHSFMFGHTCVLSVHDVRLPLPCADSLWECSSPEEWHRAMKKTPEPPGFLPVLKRLLSGTPIHSHCSAYGRLILLHGLFSVTAHLKARDLATLGVGQQSSSNSPRLGPIDTWKDTLEKALDTWSFSLVSRSSSLALEASKPMYRMAYVAIFTDITDIHILAGAPSLLGSLLSEHERLRATARIRSWSERQESKKAIYHCLLLIQELMFTGQQYRASTDNIALRPWGLYHATLILWAYGSMLHEKEPQQKNQPPCSAEEYLVHMIMLLRDNSEDISKVACQTRELLRAVQISLEGCRWELLQEAHETLGKLIEKAG